jgi:hypothetical protein
MLGFPCRLARHPSAWRSKGRHPLGSLFHFVVSGLRRHRARRCNYLHSGAIDRNGCSCIARSLVMARLMCALGRKWTFAVQ